MVAQLSTGIHDHLQALPLGWHRERKRGEVLARTASGRALWFLALLKDPPMLILDEATAMFDPEGETALVEDLHEVLGTRTVIIIGHRPACLTLADRVLRLSARPAPSDRATRDLTDCISGPACQRAAALISSH